MKVRVRKQGSEQRCSPVRTSLVNILVGNRQQTLLVKMLADNGQRTSRAKTLARNDIAYKSRLWVPLACNGLCSKDFVCKDFICKDFT